MALLDCKHIQKSKKKSFKTEKWEILLYCRLDEKDNKQVDKQRSI